MASHQQWYLKAATARPVGCDASHDLTMYLGKSLTARSFVAQQCAARPGLTPQRGMCTVPLMPIAKAVQDPPPDFETAMRDLEELVARLEQGDLSLEESLAAFERGVMLTRACQTALKDAEQKVEILLKKAGEPAVENFIPDESKAS